MRICVIGVGYVGLVVAACLADAGNHVVCIARDAARIDGLRRGKVPFYEAQLEALIRRGADAGRLHFTTDLAASVARTGTDIVVFAVGTPMSPDGTPDLSALLSAAEEVAAAMTGPRTLITKSTVPVGTHRTISDLVRSRTPHPFSYVSNPEFLKEGAAVEDFMKPDRVIVGTDSPDARALLEQLYAPFMRKSSRLIFMDPASAELTKYAANAMLATRISFMNELARLCDSYDADIDLVRRGIGTDARIGSDFLFPGIGYGGSCFPKDLAALVQMGRQNGCPMTIAQAVQDVNERQRDLFVDKITRRLMPGGRPPAGLTLAAWGLSFKARTDDVRDSPALACIERLLGAGFRVRAFDPEAMEQARRQLGDRIELGQGDQSGYDILTGADALVVLTDWQEFRNPDFTEVAARLNQKLIFDGRNLYDPNFLRKQGFEYHCVGRPRPR